jgi:hypothetical protein
VATVVACCSRTLVDECWSASCRSGGMRSELRLPAAGGSTTRCSAYKCIVEDATMLLQASDRSNTQQRSFPPESRAYRIQKLQSTLCASRRHKNGNTDTAMQQSSNCIHYKARTATGHEGASQAVPAPGSALPMNQGGLSAKHANYNHHSRQVAQGPAQCHGFQLSGYAKLSLLIRATRAAALPRTVPLSCCRDTWHTTQ